MVTSCNLYKMTGKNSIRSIQKRLSDFDETIKEDREGQIFELRKNISELKIRNGDLYGTLEFDILRPRVTREGRQFFKESRFVKFIVVPYNKHYFYIIALARAESSDLFAKYISTYLFGSERELTKTILTEECLQEIFDNTGSELKLCGWEELDIPGLSKSSLAGTNNLADNPHYVNFNKHGIQSRYIYNTPSGKTLYITKKGAIVCFSNIEEDEFIELVKNDMMKVIDKHFQLLKKMSGK